MLALITGASRGIGRAVALELAKNNFDVALNYNHSQGEAENLLNEINALGNVKAGIFQADVADNDQVVEMFSDIKNYFGVHVSVLVNNAGLTRDNLILRMKIEDWQTVINADLNSVFYCTKSAIRDMMKAKYGRIINIASISGLIGNFGQANYSAAKAGIIGLTKAAAREYASKGITVNAVAPGVIETDMTRAMPEDARNAIINNVPLNKIGEPQDIANAVLFFAGECSKYITGQVLAVDGGLTMC